MDNAYTMETGFGALLTLEEERKKNEPIVKLSKINIKTITNGNEFINKGKDKGNETPIKKEDFNKNNEDWSPSAIATLLDACSYYDKNSTKSSKLDMDCVWKEISKEVSSRCKSLKKPKNPEQCKSKFRSMQGRYNREKMAKKFNPNECSSWEWYDTMNSLFNGNTQLIANSIDFENTKQRLNLNNDVLSLRALCDINDKNIEKIEIEQNTSRKSPLLDENEKISHIHKEESFDSTLYEDEKIIQLHSNLSTLTTPKSPRVFMKVKWNDSTPLQLNIENKEDQTCQENLSNAKPFESQDENKGFLLVNEIIGKPLNCEQEISINVSTIDRKNKGTLKNFDSCSNNSSNCFGSDTIDQGSASLSPTIQKSSYSKCMSNKYEDIGSSNKDGEDKHITSFNAMELTRSINCDYKCTCIENTTNIKCKNENKEALKETISKIGEPKFGTIPKASIQDQILATSIARNNEEVSMNIAHVDLEAHSTKMFSKGSSLASLTSQSEPSFSSKQKRRFNVSSKYKYERRNQSSRTLVTTLMRATHNIPQFKKKVRLLNRAFLTHEPNIAIALMTFGTMIQQLEKNHIVLMERILIEQSNILKDFIKTLKYNPQVREATMLGLVVRFLISLFLIGVILFGTSKTTSSWMPMDFHSSSWYEKNFDDNFFQLAWIGCCIIILFTQLLWTSFKRRPITPSLS